MWDLPGQAASTQAAVFGRPLTFVPFQGTLLCVARDVARYRHVDTH